MIISTLQHFKTVAPDNGKILYEKDGQNVVLSKFVYVPLTFTDEAIRAKYQQLDENDFQIKVEHENGIFSKLFIRRACRSLGIENKLNALINSNQIFALDWADAQYIDLNDQVFLEAMKQGQFTDAEIENIKNFQQ